MLFQSGVSQLPYRIPHSGISRTGEEIRATIEMLENSLPDPVIFYCLRDAEDPLATPDVPPKEAWWHAFAEEEEAKHGLPQMLENYQDRKHPPETKCLVIAGLRRIVDDGDGEQAPPGAGEEARTGSSGVADAARRRSYWTLAAHPSRYLVVDAVRDLEEDWWLTGDRDLRMGDRVALWKYKGHDDHRGIVGFGEVLTDPEIRDLADDGNPYWVHPETGSAQQVLVRYTIRPPELLWLEEASTGSVLRQLSVSRAQGGTAHRVTPEQWAELMDLVGGWPRADVDEDDSEVGWPIAEIRPTVASYFTMLRAELAGQRYVKAAVNREVQAATGRSRGAVEFKFANISAVLKDIGFPYVQGYQPRDNYQSALRTEVERFLAHDPEMPRLLEETPVPDLPLDVQLVQVDPPVMAPSNTSGRRRTAVGVNYLQQQERNQEIGLKGEHLVVEYERAWLAANGRPDLSERVAHIPSTLGDGAGYDVISFLLDGSLHHIEVKATCGGIMVPFFLSANELRHALEHPGAYSIYRVFDLGPKPSFYVLTGDMKEILNLTPVSYQARVKRPSSEP